MSVADVSIRRPVFAVMMITALIVFGLLAYPRIGVDLFPDVEFPVVTVTATYPGADPETMESKVADKIEEAINSLSGIKALRSTNLESVSQVVVEFELDVPAEQAVQDIRDRVSGVLANLPSGIDPPVIQKFDVGAAPIMAVALAGKLPPRELSHLADKVVKERVQRVPGVGGIDLVGQRDREIQIFVDPTRLAGQGITVEDVANAVRAQNMELHDVSLHKHGDLVVGRARIGRGAWVETYWLPEADLVSVGIPDNYRADVPAASAVMLFPRRSSAMSSSATRQPPAPLVLCSVDDDGRRAKGQFVSTHGPLQTVEFAGRARLPTRWRKPGGRARALF